MDVVLGVAVTGRVARLAMVGSPASGGQVFDQYALDLPDDATTDLADTIVGTYRAVADSGNRVAATRLCLPDASAGRDPAPDGVERGRAERRSGGGGRGGRGAGPQCRRGRRVTAGRRRHRVADGGRRGRGVDVGAGVGADRLGRCGRRVCRCAAAGARPGGHHRIMLVGQRLDLDSIAAELRSTTPVEVPPDAGFAIARGAAQTAEDSGFPGGRGDADGASGCGRDADGAGG